MSPLSKLVRDSSARGAAAAILLLLGTPATRADSKSSAPRKTLNGLDAAAVERAKAGASQRLQDPGCLRLLTDFKDRQGRTLAQNLETWGVAAAEYVRMIPFLDGSANPGCQRKEIDLQTTPGLPPVFVCPAGAGAPNSRFAAVQARSPALAEAMVIHEMLHTLGLGENPPSSLEITERVRARCR